MHTIISISNSLFYPENVISRYLEYIDNVIKTKNMICNSPTEYDRSSLHNAQQRVTANVSFLILTTTSTVFSYIVCRCE